MKNITLREQINFNNFENIIKESAGGSAEIESVSREIFDAVQEYENAEIEGNVILEATDALDSNTITKLFRSASDISKGKNPNQSALSKAGGIAGKLAQKGLKGLGKLSAKGAKAVTDKISNKMADTKLGKLAKAGGEAAGRAKNALSKLNKVVNDAAKKLQDTKPIQNADVKIDQLLDKWKNDVGADSKTVKLAQQVGEFGKNNPKKAAFAIALLAGLASFAGSPAAGMAVGTALRTALGLAKGERASTALGKAGKTAAIGTAIGAAGGELSDAMGGETPDTSADTPAEQPSKENIVDKSTGKKLSDMSDEELDQWRQERSDRMGDRLADKAIERGSLKPQFADKYKELLASGKEFNTKFGIPLTPEESAAFQREVGNIDPKDWSKAQQWLRDNVPGAEKEFSGLDMTPEQRAKSDAELDDAMSNF